jgi:hypothetical protein
MLSLYFLPLRSYKRFKSKSFCYCRLYEHEYVAGSVPELEDVFTSESPWTHLQRYDARLADVAHDADSKSEEASRRGTHPSGCIRTAKATSETLETRVLVQQGAPQHWRREACLLVRLTELHSS